MLKNGEVLIVGGETWGQAPASAELYDPTTGAFRLTGSTTVARQYNSATLLPSGKVLIAGGMEVDMSMSYASAEIYDPATGKFTRTGSMTEGRQMQAATALADGRVLITGGGHDTSAEIYDPSSGTFATTGSLVEDLEGGSATLLQDGRVLVAGGFSGDGGATADAELFTP